MLKATCRLQVTTAKSGLPRVTPGHGEAVDVNSDGEGGMEYCLDVSMPTGARDMSLRLDGCGGQRDTTCSRSSSSLTIADARLKTRCWYTWSLR
jgi:hypothetical protein